MKTALLERVLEDVCKRKLLVTVAHWISFLDRSNDVPPGSLDLLAVLLLVNLGVHIEDRQYMCMAHHEDVVVHEELGEQLDAILVRVQKRLLHFDLGLLQRHLVRVEYEDLVLLRDKKNVVVFTDCVLDLDFLRVVRFWLRGVLQIFEVEVPGGVYGVVARNVVHLAIRAEDERPLPVEFHPLDDGAAEVVLEFLIEALLCACFVESIISTCEPAKLGLGPDVFDRVNIGRAG